MKCSGKQQLYPSDVEELKKLNNEQRFIDVVNKAQSQGQPKSQNLPLILRPPDVAIRVILMSR